MSFRIPSFPLAVDVYTGPWLTRAFREQVQGNLCIGRRSQDFPDFNDISANVYTGTMFLLLPPGTDVRDMNQNIPANDVLEVPSGSGRWYAVALVDDVAKGFDNEHRYALINKISARVNATDFAGLYWPTPLT